MVNSFLIFLSGCCYFYIILFCFSREALSMEISLLNNGIFVDSCYLAICAPFHSLSFSLSLSHSQSHLQFRIESIFFPFGSQKRRRREEKNKLNNNTLANTKTSNFFCCNVMALFLPVARKFSSLIRSVIRFASIDSLFSPDLFTIYFCVCFGKKKTSIVEPIRLFIK